MNIDYNSLETYDYTLPEELIAYKPAPTRDGSRMLVLNKNTGEIQIHSFSEIIKYLHPNDCLVLNNTKVIRGRIYGKKDRTGALIEALLIEKKSDRIWKALVKPGKRARLGSKIYLVHNRNETFSSDIFFTVLEVKNDGTFIIELNCSNIIETLQNFGHMPLPPYIKREDDINDSERYQTVYSKSEGAIAAPTAGLHFTKEILSNIKSNGVNIAELTLHVGAGTFKPVKDNNINNHIMHEEEYLVSKECADIINLTRKNSGKIVAVGTTSVRTLESVIDNCGIIQAGIGSTDIFIRPPTKLKAIDALLTNFHLPKSTLIMLVSAFAGIENIQNAYAVAIKEKMRFYSYGDCMLII